jgi:hypothetical protein
VDSITGKITGDTHVFVIVLTIIRVSEFAPPGIQHILSYAAGWLAALGMEHIFRLPMPDDQRADLFVSKQAGKLLLRPLLSERDTLFFFVRR